jgi:hypothetical protein
VVQPTTHNLNNLELTYNQILNYPTPHNVTFKRPPHDIPYFTMSKLIKPIYVAEGLWSLLEQNYGRLAKKLPALYALTEFVLRTPKFRLEDARTAIKHKIKHLPSQSTIANYLRSLIEKDIIVRSREGKRDQYRYDLSSKAILSLETSSKYYSQFLDAKYERNPVSFDHNSHLTGNFYHYDDGKTGFEQYRVILEPGIETEQFLHAYLDLTSQWNIYLGDKSIDPDSRVPYARANLPRHPFQIDQPPEAFGRTGAKPYAFIGKTHLPDLRPAHDPGLKVGRQFMLDFSSFEPRILAFITNHIDLINMANSGSDMYNELYHCYLSDYPITDVKRLVLAWINGAGSMRLAEFVDPDEFGKLRYNSADEMLNKLMGHFPTIEAYRLQLASDWKENGELRTPDGNVMLLSYTKKNKLGIKTLTPNELRRKSLALLLQTYGGLLSQAIITGAQSLEFASLRLCVYDGFMFYCRKEHYEAALMEVSQLLVKTTKRIFPTVFMPFKLEWANDSHGLLFSKERGDTQPITFSDLDSTRENDKSRVATAYSHAIMVAHDTNV